MAYNLNWHLTQAMFAALFHLWGDSRPREYIIEPPLSENADFSSLLLRAIFIFKLRPAAALSQLYASETGRLLKMKIALVTL